MPPLFSSQKSDRCKRVSLGILLSFFVIAVVFGTVSAFVTNQYTYSGWVNMREKVENKTYVNKENNDDADDGDDGDNGDDDVHLLWLGQHA